MTTFREWIRDTSDLISDRCSSLSDQENKSKWGLKFMMVFLHVLVVGFVFVLDPNLLISHNHVPWYQIVYFCLFLVTLGLYIFTSNSSPGYVIDAMRARNEMCATFINTSNISKQPSSQRDNFVENERLISSERSPWFQLVSSLYPLGSHSRDWTCSLCNVHLPPRSKHCHECGTCILQFDHHCVWLGNCIGQKNRCRFWWYILAQTCLCAWTVVLYFRFVRLDINKYWWEDFLAIFALAVLTIILIFLVMLLVFHSYLAMTNQTTFELARRRRIPYMRPLPAKVRPFSKGICVNLYNFCWPRGKSYVLEPVPSLDELQAQVEPYTCLDCLTCKCC